jgi:glutamate-5-semialdehyde dehydrogenase
MTKPQRVAQGTRDVGDIMREVGQAARAAARELALAPAEQKNEALRSAAAALRASTP